MISKLKKIKPALLKVLVNVRELGISPFKPLVIFDVGANNGSSFEVLPKVLPWVKIHAFEPTPHLIDIIQQKMGRTRNYHLIPKAVGSNPGTAQFNIAGQSDWGCSSLLDFSDNLEKTWPGREDFKVTEKLEVEIIRLDDYVREHGIEQIDFLHIDTQGTDLDVLKSLGDALSKVHAGVVEVPQSSEVMLYKGQHSREEMLEFLEQNGFYVWKEIQQQNETNIYFRKNN